MNFQQLEYIIAVDRFKHFGKAAQHCHVTQPTLSMMIIQLEEELGIQIFDRSTKPILTTKAGAFIIAKAHHILHQKRELENLSNADYENKQGSITIGIIPTLAPYLLPLFIQSLSEKYPLLEVNIEETNTSAILSKLKSEDIDIGIMATPLQENGFQTVPIFYEAFYLFGNIKSDKQYVVPDDIDPERLLLLEEGHCLSTQVSRLCKLHKNTSTHVNYRIGSLETLKILVRQNQGITILPELAIPYLDSLDSSRVKAFEKPVPGREISMVSRFPSFKTGFAQIVKKVILDSVPGHMHHANNITPIEI